MTGKGDAPRELYQAVGSQPVGVRIAVPTRKILCLDDDAMILAMYQGLFRRMREVQTFSQGQEAVTAFLSEPSAYGAILTDYQMPGMDGLEFLAAIQEHPHPLRVLLSGNPSYSLQDQAKARGALGLLRKPVEPAVLRAIVTEMLAGPHSETLDAYAREQRF